MAVEVVHPHKLRTHYFKSRFLYMARVNPNVSRVPKAFREFMEG